MSANLVVDIGGTCQFNPSINSQYGPASGGVVGTIIDMKDADTFCNVFVAGGAASGPVGIQIQTSENVASGNFLSGGGFPISGSFSDPTSGLAQLPTNISSGGILWINSGLVSIPGGGGASGGQNVNTFQNGIHPMFNAQGAGAYQLSGTFPVFGSGGGVAFAAFQRPHRFARLVMLSGASVLPGLIAGFVSQYRTTGSGGGFTYNPQTGTVNV